MRLHEQVGKNSIVKRIKNLIKTKPAHISTSDQGQGLPKVRPQTDLMHRSRTLSPSSHKCYINAVAHRRRFGLQFRPSIPHRKSFFLALCQSEKKTSSLTKQTSLTLLSSPRCCGKWFANNRRNKKKIPTSFLPTELREVTLSPCFPGWAAPDAPYLHRNNRASPASHWK